MMRLTEKMKTRLEKRINIEQILVVDGDVVRLWGCFKLTVQ